MLDEICPWKYFENYRNQNLVLFYDFGTNSTHLCHAKSLRLNKFQPNKI